MDGSLRRGRVTGGQAGHRSRVVLVGLALVVPVSVLLALCWWHTQQAARTVHFPADRSVGVLQVRDVGSTDAGAWRGLGEAQGDVVVPAGKVAMLAVSVEGFKEASALGVVRAGDLQLACTGRTQGTDAGLADLKGLTWVPFLNLSDTQITDAGLAHLAGLTSLHTLDLSATQITDAGLAHLEGLTSLKSLELSDTQITDAGLAHLKALTSLETLGLWGTKITDAGLAHLKGLTSLRSLVLAGTQITDAGLAHLKGLTSLQQLYLSHTKVSDAGIQGLKQALPKCRISR